MSRARAVAADVALLLEGTFPYVGGGVSSWVDHIVRAFPELRFAVVFLGGRQADYGAPKYELAANVVHFESHYLYDPGPSPPARARTGDRRRFEAVQAMHDAFAADPATALAAFGGLAGSLMPGGGLPADDFLYGERAWRMICRAYRERCDDPSFVDYFWTVRMMHQPLWQLARIAYELLPARAYHSVSTGYAGFLGALLRRLRRRPLILSEHGIYTKERKIDLMKSDWIRDNRHLFQRDPTELSYFRRMWMGFFEWLGRFCYDAADPIIALYEQNRRRQVADGADPARTLAIPNGISVARFAPLRARRPAAVPPVLCLIGRVVPIKDIKTFVRAMRRVANLLPGAEGWIAGPQDEDPVYAEECRDLVDSLGLGGQVSFLGFQPVAELLPRIGVNVLSSISEALPLVILEGFAAGVPAVATDVGACRQLIDGQDDADRALGRAGAVVAIADPQGLADAAVALLTDQAAWRAASRAGIARVERHYTDELMLARYRAVYRSALARDDG